jgi:hypothetical protein
VALVALAAKLFRALATGTLALPPLVIEGLEEFKGSFVKDAHGAVRGGLGCNQALNLLSQLGLSSKV